MADRPSELLPSTVTPFTEDYFMRGEELGLSGYSNYVWRPDSTLPMAAYMKRFVGIKDGDKVLDFGAARGFLVKALRMLGVEAYGYDISAWAVENADPIIREHLSNELKAEPMSYDFIVAKDVMEHVPEPELKPLLIKLLAATRKAILIIVPLTHIEGGPYLCPRDEGDKTHQIRWNLTAWLKFLQNIDRRCVCQGSLYVPEIKQANVAWEDSCGFFVIRRF